MNKKCNKFQAILFFFKQHPRIYLGLFFITVMYTVMESISLSIFFPIFKSILGDKTPSGGVFAFVETLIKFIPLGDKFISACLLAASLLAIKEALAFTRQAIIGYGTARVVCDTKESVFDKYIHSDYQFFLDHKQGELIYNTVGATRNLATCLQYIPEIGAAMLMTITIGALLIIISPSATIFLLVVGILFNFVTHVISQKISYILGKERATLSSEAYVIVNEFFDGVKHIKAFGGLERWVDNFRRSTRNFKRIVTKDAIWVALLDRALYLLIPAIIIGAGFYFKYSKAGDSNLLLSNLASVGVYAFAILRLLPSLTALGKLHMQILGSLSDVELLYQVLKEETSRFKDGGRTLSGFSKEIRFENVNFNHKSGRTILKDLNFTIKKGRTTAIIGSSGAGKTTLINILMRLFDYGEGKISIDGINIREIKYSSLIKIISLVSQETFIFNGSIKENIIFGLSHIQLDKVVEAAKCADAHKFIVDLPDGYETIVGDKGMKLSGGQRQRIAIARAVLRDPEVLILDEATSSLDHNSEFQVQQAINMASKNRTILIVAHRLSTIINADNIIVLDKGRIAESGCHAELINRKGLYKRLHEVQFNIQ